MGRAKISLELIQKEKSRNSTFLKRKNCLKKKVHELSTLCGVKAVMIIYGQDHPLQPEIWPEDRVEVLELIKKYKDQSPEDRKKRTTLLSDFFVERNKKAQVELIKLRKSNAQAKYPTWDLRFDGLFEDKLREIANFLENKIAYAKTFKMMKENNSNYHANQMQQQHKMLSKNRSMHFEGSDQPKKCLYTADFREPMGISYDHQFPRPMQTPMPVPMQHHMHTLSNDCGCGPSNIVYATPLAKIEPNMVYNDPMTSRMVAGMSESISQVNNLIRAPPMYYYGDAIQPMFQNYIEEVMLPMPQTYIDEALQPMPNYIEYPIMRTRSVSSLMLGAPSYPKDGHYD